jgi:hypothetical protein
MDMSVSGMSGMSGMAGMTGSSGATDKQTFGAQVVSKTLDYMNSGSAGGAGKNPDYDFQNKVLAAGMANGKGTSINTMV